MAVRKNEIKAAFERVSARMSTGNFTDAENLCRDALAKFPDDGNLLCLLGAALVRQSRPDEAEAILRAVASRFPDFAKVHEELGNALMSQDRHQEAIECFQHTIELESDNGPAHYKLGTLLNKIGNTRDGEKAMEIAASLAPNRVAMAQAAEYQRAGDLAKAEQACHEILARDPDNPDAFRLLAELAMQRKQFGDAVVFSRRAVELAPNMVAAWLNMASALAEREEFDEAIDAARKAVELEPGLAKPWRIVGDLLTRTGKYEQAIDAFRTGLKKQSDNVGCLAGLGHALKTIGQRNEAIQTYRDWVRMHPSFGEGYWSLANLKNYEFTDAEVKAMHQQIRDPKLPDEPRVHFCFALGKAHEDRAEFDHAFDYYEQGNSARRMKEVHDPVELEVIHDRIIDVFTDDFLDKRADLGQPDPAPIFIVGLPRSGSTLIEQILASHSQVDGTRELTGIGQIIHMIDRQTAAYPEALLDMTADDLRWLGDVYLESTLRHRGGKQFFTDKMPNNFPSVGLIHLILPNAKIIDARRHPLDSCMSSYKQLFFKGQPFTYDLVELGEYYLQYRRMMDHWHQSLPGKVLDIQYEELIADQESQTRRLLEHCGLPWEEACLSFHETERAVFTASSEQVRQPLYRTAVNHWRNYEHRLEAVIDVLAPVLRKLPEAQRPASLSRKPGGT
jgi:tetratricopeptide (TPR) repeat protein